MEFHTARRWDRAVAGYPFVTEYGCTVVGKPFRESRLSGSRSSSEDIPLFVQDQAAACKSNPPSRDKRDNRQTSMSGLKSCMGSIPLGRLPNQGASMPGLFGSHLQYVHEPVVEVS